MMSLAVEADGRAGPDPRQVEMATLRRENAGLRELLGIAGVAAPGVEDDLDAPA